MTKDEFKPTGLAGMAFEIAKGKKGEKPVTQLYGGSSGLAEYAGKMNKPVKKSKKKAKGKSKISKDNALGIAIKDYY